MILCRINAIKSTRASKQLIFDKPDIKLVLTIQKKNTEQFTIHDQGHIKDTHNIDKRSFDLRHLYSHVVHFDKNKSTFLLHHSFDK